jgi:hypothetical protein
VDEPGSWGTIEYSDAEYPWTGTYWHHDTASCGAYHGGLEVYSKTVRNSGGTASGAFEPVAYERLFVYYSEPE